MKCNVCGSNKIVKAGTVKVWLRHESYTMPRFKCKACGRVFEKPGLRASKRKALNLPTWPCKKGGKRCR